LKGNIFLQEENIYAETIFPPATQSPGPVLIIKDIKRSYKKRQHATFHEESPDESNKNLMLGGKVTFLSLTGG
jgi:hypothetical protein